MADIRINEVSVSGRSVRVSNGQVTIDGIDMTPDTKHINIELTGNVRSRK